MDLTDTAVLGKKIQLRFINSLKHTTHLTSLNISGTAWEKPGDFIGAFTENLSITKLIVDQRKQKSLPPQVLRIIEHYIQLNEGLNSVL